MARVVRVWWCLVTLVVSGVTSLGCHSDEDCYMGSVWRCGKSTDPGSLNCHLPGPGTAGNSTCSCHVAKCGTCPDAPTNATALQYLMVGDSISLGMLKYVESNLSTVGIETTHNHGNAGNSNLGSHCLTSWGRLTTRKWDLISFNFGLHDLAYDTELITPETYTKLLTNITNNLLEVQKKYGTKLLWVDTTPVPTVPVYGPGCNDTKVCLNPPRFDVDVVTFNQAAAKVMDEARGRGGKIEVVDLYSFVLKRCGGKGYSTCPGFQLPRNVHYTTLGWKTIAPLVFNPVMKMLGKV